MRNNTNILSYNNFTLSLFIFIVNKNSYLDNY